MATEADYARIGNYARMYNKDQNIDRLKSTRTVPLEVICPGYSRTGTLTMHKAMTILGYPDPYHFSSIYDNIRDSDGWMLALNAKFQGIGEMPDKKFFDGMLGHAGAVMDAPCNFFTKELVEFYPDAKVVLVERELESWYKSWINFCMSAYNPVIFFLGRLDGNVLGRITRIGEALTLPQAGWAMTVDQARVRSKDAYRHHYRDVRDVVPKERLLEFKLGDGWEPLCGFLGKPVPDVPFPHENDAASNEQGFKELGQLAMGRILKKALVAVTVLAIPFAAVWYSRSR